MLLPLKPPLQQTSESTLPRTARLRAGYQYDAVRNHGKTTRGSLFRLSLLLPSEHLSRKSSVSPDTTENSLLASTQCGIIASRRVGGAVIRNRVKRRLRDLYRHERAQLHPNLWLVMVATPKAAMATPGELHAEWLKLGRRLAIFKDC